MVRVRRRSDKVLGLVCNRLNSIMIRCRGRTHLILCPSHGRRFRLCPLSRRLGRRRSMIRSMLSGGQEMLRRINHSKLHRCRVRHRSLLDNRGSRISRAICVPRNSNNKNLHHHHQFSHDLQYLLYLRYSLLQKQATTSERATRAHQNHQV